MDDDLDFSKKLKLDKIKKYMPDMDTQEDVVPYDENANTLTNVGRFALNNLMTDQFSGGMPAMGAVKAVKEASLSVPLIEKLMQKAPAAASELMNVGKAKDLAEGAAQVAQQAGTAKSFLDQAKAQQNLSRAVDFSNRLADQTKAIRADRLRKLMK